MYLAQRRSMELAVVSGFRVTGTVEDDVERRIGNDPKFAKFAETLKRLGEGGLHRRAREWQGNEPHSGSGDEPVTQLQVATWMEFGTSDDPRRWRSSQSAVPPRDAAARSPKSEAFVTNASATASDWQDRARRRA